MLGSRPMTTKALQTILTQHTDEIFISATLIVGKGEVNEIYHIKTQVSAYVIRVSSETDLGRFQKEAWCMKQATELGISGPTVLGLGSVEAGTYMLLTFVPGENGADLTGDTLHVWHTLGRFAAAIHAIPVTGFGERMTHEGHFDGSWSTYLQDNLRDVHAEGVLVAKGMITTAQAKQLTELFVDLRRAHLKLGLIHQDLSLKNTLVRADGKVSLLDWGSAQVHVIPHMELEEILSEGIEARSPAIEAFLEGYDLSTDAFVKIMSEIWALRLLLRTDKLRWALDNCPEQIEYYAQQLQRSLAKSGSV